MRKQKPNNGEKYKKGAIYREMKAGKKTKQTVVKKMKKIIQF